MVDLINKDNPRMWQSAIEGAKNINDIVGTFDRLFGTNTDIYVLSLVKRFNKIYNEIKGTADFMRKFDLLSRLQIEVGSKLEEVLLMSGANLTEVKFDLDQVPGPREIGKEMKTHFKKAGADIQWDMDLHTIKGKITKLRTQQNEIRKRHNLEAEKAREGIEPELQGILKKSNLIMDRFYDLEHDYSDVLSSFENDPSPRLRERREEYDAKRNGLKKEQEACRQEHANLLEACRLKLEPISTADSLAHQKIEAEINEIQSEVGDQIIEVVLQKSPISETQAMEWANAQAIPKNAQARMTKAGYKAKDVRKDMAEFYRLTGGRLPKCEVVTEGRRRACAKLEKNQISVDSHFSKKTLFHEMGHLLENDQKIQRTAQEFLTSRIKPGVRPVRLNRLDPDAMYHPSEMAFQDAFFSPYVGKYYPNGVTEVISMGVQMFSNPGLMLDLYSRDLEMFNMIYGMLLTPPGENELSESMKEVNAAIEEKMRKETFFKALNEKIKDRSIFAKHTDDYRLVAYTKPGGKRPSLWQVYMFGEQVLSIGFKSEKASLQFVYLSLLYPAKQFVHEATIRNQEAPNWYKTGDPIPEVK